VSCGKIFAIVVEADTGKIITPCFYGGNIRRGNSYGKFKAKTDSSGNMILEDGLIVWVHNYPWYKELKYELIGWKRTLLHQYTESEYIECEDCLNEHTLDGNEDNLGDNYDREVS
jgi:hypothetical protein